MRGRLLGGTSRGPRSPQVPGSWHCSVCNMGGCWPGRDHCFRCLTPRYANARRREANFPGRPPHHGVSREPTMRAPIPQPAPKSGPRPPPCAASPPSSALPPGQAQAVLKTLKGLGISDALLLRVQQSLVPPQKPAASKLRQLAHLDEQLKALKTRIQRQTLAVDRHREQGERMQEKLLNTQIEEDKLKEEFKALKDAPPSQSSSHPALRWLSLLVPRLLDLYMGMRLWKTPTDLSPL